MAQDRDQYVQFTIKLLKGSFALNALWQDALHYHMIDQPEKLIALRLTEYYEMVSRGVSRPGPALPLPPPATPMPAMQPAPPTPTNGNGHTPQPPGGGIHSQSDQQPTEAIRKLKLQRHRPQESSAGEPESDIIHSADAQTVEQNADEAADYWTPL